jgi:hypothetical protein
MCFCNQAKGMLAYCLGFSHDIYCYSIQFHYILINISFGAAQTALLNKENKLQYSVFNGLPVARSQQLCILWQKVPSAKTAGVR